MADLIISYYGGVTNQCAAIPLGSETVTTSGTSAQSGANDDFGAVASLFSTTAHYVTSGSDPTATAANGVYLPASTLVWLDLTNGHKFAAITA